MNDRVPILYRKFFVEKNHERNTLFQKLNSLFVCLQNKMIEM